jgi:hypothetical protein
MRKRSGSPLSLFSFQDILTSLMGVVFLIVLLLSLELVHRAPNVSDLTRQDAERLKEETTRLEQQCQILQDQLNSLYENMKLAVGSLEQLKQKHLQLQQLCKHLRSECDALQTSLQEANQQAVSAEKQFARDSEERRIAELRQKIAQLQAKLDQLQKEDFFIFNPVPGGLMPWLVDLAGPAWTVVSAETFRIETAFPQHPMQERISAFIQWARSRDPRREYFVLFVRPSGLPAYDELRKKLETLGFQLGVDVLGDSQKLFLGKGSPSS